MNAIRQTALLNKRELENAVPPSASWHVDYRDTAWLYVGGLPLDLSEGDVVTIFSQFGSPTHLNLIRDKETGKSKGFGFLRYEDQRSCDLAVDNLGGADVLGRLLRVDHTRYKKREGEDEETWKIERLEAEASGEGNGGGRVSDTESEGEGRVKKKRRKVLKEETELAEMLAIQQDGEDEDPMRGYLIKEKRHEVERVKEREKRHKHKHRHRHRLRNGEDGSDEETRHRDKHRSREESKSDDDNRQRSHRRRDGDGDARRHTSNRNGGGERYGRRSRSRSYDRSGRRRRNQDDGSDNDFHSRQRSRSPRHSERR